MLFDAVLRYFVLGGFSISKLLWWRRCSRLLNCRNRLSFRKVLFNYKSFCQALFDVELVELAREIDGAEVVYVAAKDLVLVGHAEVAEFFGEVEKQERQR